MIKENKKILKNKKNEIIVLQSIICLVSFFIIVAYINSVDEYKEWVKYDFIKYFVDTTILFYLITSIILFFKLPPKHRLIQVGNILALIAFYSFKKIQYSIPSLTSSIFLTDTPTTILLVILWLIYPVFKYSYFIAVYTDKLKNNNKN